MSKPDESVISDTFIASITNSKQCSSPYEYWLLNDCLPEESIDELISLPIEPVYIEDTKGERASHNDSRFLFGEENRQKYEVMDSISKAFQSSKVVDTLATLTHTSFEGTSLRIEYCQDTKGFWLEPHNDIGVKVFTMLIYLNREPEAVNWGTDIYADKETYAGRIRADFNSAVIFIPSDKTWHGFEKREITGVRRALIINYVTPEWRNRDELCFPNESIR